MPVIAFLLIGLTLGLVYSAFRISAIFGFYLGLSLVDAANRSEVLAKKLQEVRLTKTRYLTACVDVWLKMAARLGGESK